ncbi:MAG: DUF3280 domain-containing protein [Rhizobiales bacterium]|nr:DUF3280 domain-containing protein [Hyphomicrobiales bacterium]
MVGLVAGDAAAAEPKVAVFDFELVDTSLEGATYGPRADQQRRLVHTSDQLRDRLAKSGRVAVVDIAPIAAEVKAANLRTCDGCDADFANQLGADFAVSGWVQKVSNLILNMNIMVRDAKTARVISLKSVDMRGNTDESWSRAIDWLVRNDLLAVGGQGVFQ